MKTRTMDEEPKTEDRMLSTAEVASFLGVDRSTTVRLIHSNEIVASRVGAQWRVSKKALDDFIERGSNGDTNPDRLLLLREVERILGVSRKTLLRYIADKKIPACKVGAYWRIRRADVDAFVAAGSK